MVRGCPQGRTNWTARRSDLGRFVPMRTQGALAGLTLLVVVLAGCTGASPDPMPATQVATTTPSPSPSPSSTPSPTPTSSPDEFDASVEPVAPPELDGPPSKEAAGEVAKYFMAHFPYIAATGDFTRWDAMSGEVCNYCASSRSIAHDLVMADRHSVGGEIEFTDVLTWDHRPNQFAVLLRFREHPSQTLDHRGVIVEDFPGIRDDEADMLVVWRDGAWQIDSVIVDVVGEES